MLKLSDLYTHYEQLPVKAGDTVYGTAIVRYDVRKYTDVRNLGVRVCYLVNCTQRLRIPNRSYNGLDPKPSPAGYSGYPALIWNQIVPKTAAGTAASATLVSYAPKTLNASIESSRNVSSNTDSSFQQEHTSGSAVSQTNTFGVSGSLGFFGDAPTGDFGASYESSTTTENSSSDTRGQGRSQGSELSEGASMSIKDWACFAAVDDANQAPSWTWSQEYPWNVMLFRAVDSDQNILLPPFVLDRLYLPAKPTPPGPATVFPPSELSLFGVDQVARCSWIVIPDPKVPDSENITVEHSISVCEGSHVLKHDSGKAPVFQVNLAYHEDIPKLVSKVLELGLLALDPISGEDPADAAVNFAEDPFQAAPVNGKGFLVTSRSNKLRLSGQGFGPGMSTDFTHGAVSVHIDFKVAEEYDDLTVFLKHWKTTSQPGCMLTITVNGDTARQIVKHVDSPEGDGVDKNITAITVRNRDYLSADYCDLAVMGLNTIDIAVTPGGSGCGYQLHAVAIA